MFYRTIVYILLLPLVSCGSGSGFLKGNIDAYPKGTDYATAEMSVEDAYDNFKFALEENEEISVMAEVNHATNAEAAGIGLPDSRIIFFGNPEMGTQLMLRNQLVGLDLPLRVLFYEKDERVVAVFNSASYLERRYMLGGSSMVDQISANLNSLVGKALNTEVIRGKSMELTSSQGIKTVQSNRNFPETYSALKETIENNKDIELIAELDHQANAASADMELRPTRLIVFGNPNVGTPIMQSAISTGLDLPQKILVWEDEDGTVNISYNTPEFLQLRHDFKGARKEMEMISTALLDLTRTAAGF